MIQDWLPHYLGRLFESFAPHDWPQPDTVGWQHFVEDFHRAFARNGVSEAEADLARSLLVEDPPRFKTDYIPKIVAAVKTLRDASVTGGSAPAPPLVLPPARIVEESRGCPECHAEAARGKPAGPTGWARRRMTWHSIPRPVWVDLFCRCPYGRWRINHDVELTRNERVRQHDDLQARPELWDFELAHPSWSWQSCEHDLVMPEGTDGLWWYLKPDEPAPEPIAPAALAGRVAGDLGHVEPAIPIPPKPVPEPDPAVLEEREESYKWV